MALGPSREFENKHNHKSLHASMEATHGARAKEKERKATKELFVAIGAGGAFFRLFHHPRKIDMICSRGTSHALPSRTCHAIG